MEVKLIVLGILIIAFVFAFLKIYFNEKQQTKYTKTCLKKIYILFY